MAKELKSVNALWNALKDIKGMGLEPLVKNIRKKDLAQMSFMDICHVILENLYGKENASFIDIELGEISDTEWERLDEEIPKHLEKFSFYRDMIGIEAKDEIKGLEG